LGSACVARFVLFSVQQQHNQNSATIEENPLLFRYFPPTNSFRPEEKKSATFEQSSGKIRYLAAVLFTGFETFPDARKNTQKIAKSGYEDQKLL